MNIFNYKLDEKVNLTLENIEFFLNAFEIDDLSNYSDLDIVVKGKNFVFFRDDIKTLFSSMLALHHLKAIHFHIDYLSREFPVSEYKIEGDIQEYLYKNIDNYIYDIRIGTEIPFGLALKVEDFLLGYLKIIYQEKNISLLENYKILDNLISSIKSKLGNEYIQKEIDLFYDLDFYKENLYSIFPLLVELNNSGYINIIEIKYSKGEIGFNLRVLSDLEKINKKDIVEIFGSSDELKEDKEYFDGLNLVNGKDLLELNGYKLRLAEFIFIENKHNKKIIWGDTEKYIYGEEKIKGDSLLSLIKKFNTDLRSTGINISLSYVSGSHIILKKT